MKVGAGFYRVESHQLAVEYLRLEVDIGVDLPSLPQAPVRGQDGGARGVRRRRDCLRCSGRWPAKMRIGYLALFYRNVI